MKDLSVTRRSELCLFGAGLAVFVVAAVLGWIKLKYGFNFLDEGYHMTESWRLSAGDSLVRDGLTDTLILYTLINSIIFRMFPDITLLGFREIQYFLTIAALLLFSAALYHSYRKYWYLPLVFSLFAFTGLDPQGIISNLSYYTYPHLFLTIFVSFMILGLYSGSRLWKRVFFVGAGMSLWGTSISALYLSVVVASPVLIYLLLRASSAERKYDFADLCFTLAPFVILWAVFLIHYNRAYVESVLSFSRLMVNAHWTLTGINWDALQHTGVTGLFLLVIFAGYRKLGTAYFFALSAVAAILMYFVIRTSLFGLMAPYYHGWFSSPMWFTSLLMCAVAAYWVVLFSKVWFRKRLSPEEELGLAIMVPATVQSITASVFSTNGVLLTLHSAIPLTAASALLLFSLVKKGNLEKQGNFVKQESDALYPRVFVLPLVLLPFYLTTAWADWMFTFFDVQPKHATVQIQEGFGRGISTNPYYRGLYEWISEISGEYSAPDDFIISYVISPMAYMIAHRRPALDHSFTSLDSRSREYFERSVEKMKDGNRTPRLAFVFESMIGLIASPSAEDEYGWFDKQFNFPSDDPISRYVADSMFLLDRFCLDERVSVMCFIDNPLDPAVLKLKRAIARDPDRPDLHRQMGDLLVKKQNYDSALVSYRRCLSLYPNGVDAMAGLARAYVMAGRMNDARETLRKIVEFQPDKADGFYNLACVNAMMNREDEAMQALQKAVDLGFSDCRLLREDRDLGNIRESALFKEILGQRCAD